MAKKTDVSRESFPGDPDAFAEAAGGGVTVADTSDGKKEKKTGDQSLCPVCGSAFPRRANKTYCGADCRKKARAQRQERVDGEPERRVKRDGLRLPKVKIELAPSDGSTDPKLDGVPYLCGIVGDCPMWHVSVHGVTFSRRTYQIERDEEGNGKIGARINANVQHLTLEQAQAVLDTIVYKFVRFVGEEGKLRGEMLSAKTPYFNGREGDVRPLADYLVMVPATDVPVLDASASLTVPTISKMYEAEE